MDSVKWLKEEKKRLPTTSLNRTVPTPASLKHALKAGCTKKASLLTL